MIGRDRENITPCDIVTGEFNKDIFLKFNVPHTTFVEIIDKIYNTGAEALKEREMFVKGFLLGDGSSGNYRYKSRIKFCWHLNKQDFNLIQKLQKFRTEVWNGIDFK